MAYQPQPRRYKPFKRRTPDFRCLYDNLLRALEDKSGQQLTHLLSQPHFNSDALLRCRPWEKSLLVSAIEKHNFCCVEILVNTPHILFHVKQVQAFEAVFEEPMEKTRVRLFYILMKSEQVKLNRLISSVLPYVNTEQGTICHTVFS